MKVDADVPFDVAALFGCAVVTAAGCVSNSAEVQPGEDVAVLGLRRGWAQRRHGRENLGRLEHHRIDINESEFPLTTELPERDVPRYMRSFQDGKMPVDRLKSGAMRYAEINRNLDLLDRGAVIRPVLLPHG